MRTSNEIRAEIDGLLAQQEAILARDTEQKMEATDESQFENIQARLEVLAGTDGTGGELKRSVDHEAFTSKFRSDKPEAIKPEAVRSEDPEEGAKVYADAFSQWLRFGSEGLTPEQRMSMRPNRANPEGRAIGDNPQTVTTTGGGYLIPQGFQAELVAAMKAFGGVRKVARILNTPAGNPLPWPTYDDTASTGELLAINTAVADQIVTYGVKTLGAFKYSSKIVLVPLELAQDNAFDLDAHLREVLSTRIGRITNTHFTTGAGTTLPKGVTVSSSTGATAGAATGVTFDDLVNVEHSVDPAYRTAGSCSYMFADATFKLLKKIKDADGRPIWQQGVSQEAPSTINGYPYVINQDMPAATTGLVSVVFGDFSYYVIRDVMDVTVLRLVERYAELGQVGYIAFSRHDGQGVAAESSFGPLKRLTQA